MAVAGSAWGRGSRAPSWCSSLPPAKVLPPPLESTDRKTIAHKAATASDSLSGTGSAARLYWASGNTGGTIVEANLDGTDAATIDCGFVPWGVAVNASQ